MNIGDVIWGGRYVSGSKLRGGAGAFCIECETVFKERMWCALCSSARGGNVNHRGKLEPTLNVGFVLMSMNDSVHTNSSIGIKDSITARENGNSK
jgi:hypothetical protein